jgi:hypothetical protein
VVLWGVAFFLGLVSRQRCRVVRLPLHPAQLLSTLNADASWCAFVRVCCMQIIWGLMRQQAHFVVPAPTKSKSR